MRKIGLSRLFLVGCVTAGTLVVAAPAAMACQGPDGEPCPGAEQCHAINDFARKVYKDGDLLACPT